MSMNNVPKNVNRGKITPKIKEIQLRPSSYIYCDLLNVLFY